MHLSAFDAYLRVEQGFFFAEVGFMGYVIWERDKADTQCPQTHEFLCPLPNSYSTSSGMRPLPPSFQVIFPGVPGLFANTFYTISVHVSRVWKIIPKPILT